MYYYTSDGKGVAVSYNVALGGRILISISSDVDISSKAANTKTIVSRGNEYTYNVWNLITK